MDIKTDKKQNIASISNQNIPESLDLEFPNANFFIRIFRRALLGIITVLCVGVFLMLQNKDFSLKNNLNVYLVISIYSLSALLYSFYVNRFYILKLTADRAKIEIAYYFMLKKHEFLSEWINIEIIQSSSIQKFPSIILKIKYKEKVIVKLYSGVNKELTDEKMILLIEILKRLKMPAANSNLPASRVSSLC